MPLRETVRNSPTNTPYIGKSKCEKCDFCGGIQMRKVKIAQIGTSAFSHGNFIFNSLKKQQDLFDIVGYAMPEGERERLPERMADFAGYPELTVEEIMKDPEIEAVTVETEEKYLTKYALWAASAGKHIHMEKPGGCDLAAFETLIETVRAQKKVFHTGYMYRYNPVIADLLEKVGRGELGDITGVEAQMNCDHTTALRQWLSEYPGGSMFFLGCHMIDLVLLIKGKPNRVIPLNKQTGVADVRADDFGMAVFEYDNGNALVKVNSTEKGGFSRRQLVVTGTKGTVELKPIEMLVKEGEHYTTRQFTTKTVYTSDDWFDSGKTENSPFFDRYDPMMTAFAQAVTGKKENPYTYAYELELYKTVRRACGYTD